jgi:hypothetical protein
MQVPGAIVSVIATKMKTPSQFTIVISTHRAIISWIHPSMIFFRAFPYLPQMFI